MIPPLGLLLEVALIAAGVLSALHALVWKRDPRSALAWIGVCLLYPLLGVPLYWMFGVNRLRTLGRRLRRRPAGGAGGQGAGVGDPEVPADLAHLARIADTLTRRPLLRGNRVQPLHSGEQAFPAMLAAIREARTSVLLCTYIFDTDSTGRAFLDALAECRRRGVDVRVLIDGIGEKYSWPRASRELRRRGVSVVRFLPPSLRRPSLHMNLRNHRKLLVVDGAVGFTGGMNIGDRHLAAATSNAGRVIDLHFRVEGPVVAQMREAFLDDWDFATGIPAPPTATAAVLEAPAAPAGTALCRAVTDGPDEDFGKLTWLLLGALATAQRRVRIMTPYFIPDRPIIAALVAAALRGVRIELLLPGKNNLPYVAWATRAMLWELLERGIIVREQPAPFVHSKLMLVDDVWALVGSANMDPRSLRLNFEFNLEVWDPALSAELGAHFGECWERSRPVTLEEVDGRSLPERVRDGFCKLFSPYL